MGRGRSVAARPNGSWIGPRSTSWKASRRSTNPRFAPPLLQPGIKHRWPEADCVATRYDRFDPNHHLNRQARRSGKSRGKGKGGKDGGKREGGGKGFPGVNVIPLGPNPALTPSPKGSSKGKGKGGKGRSRGKPRAPQCGFLFAASDRWQNPLCTKADPCRNYKVAEVAPAEVAPAVDPTTVIPCWECEGCEASEQDRMAQQEQAFSLRQQQQFQQQQIPPSAPV